MEKTSFEVIVIGGGAAGISAALWCDELGLDTLLLEARAELGGQLLRIYNNIKNHLGIETENGRAMRNVFAKQAGKRKFTVRLKSEVEKVDLTEKKVLLKSGENFSAAFIIVATGVRRRKLNIAGEEKFKDKGLIESGRRDGNLVKDKIGVIIGGGDAAFENALILGETAAKVFLVHRRGDFRARKEFVDQVLGNSKITILTETEVVKIIGDKQIEAVELRDLKTGETKILEVQAVLIRVGIAPETELYRGKLDLDEQGYIKIDSLCETNLKNVFAVGDVANPVAPTISSAVGMGATAAKAIFASNQRKI